MEASPATTPGADGRRREPNVRARAHVPRLAVDPAGEGILVLEHQPRGAAAGVGVVSVCRTTGFPTGTVTFAFASAVSVVFVTTRTMQRVAAADATRSAHCEQVRALLQGRSQRRPGSSLAIRVPSSRVRASWMRRRTPGLAGRCSVPDIEAVEVDRVDARAGQRPDPRVAAQRLRGPGRRAALLRPGGGTRRRPRCHAVLDTSRLWYRRGPARGSVWLSRPLAGSTSAGAWHRVGGR